MGEFKRERRYFVAKLKYLTSQQIEQLEEIVKDSPCIQCVVVESHWPEYESVWRAIEKRMKKHLRLFDPESPGMRIDVYRNWWQRLIYPKDFATLGEAIKAGKRAIKKRSYAQTTT